MTRSALQNRDLPVVFVRVQFLARCYRHADLQYIYISLADDQTNMTNQTHDIPWFLSWLNDAHRFYGLLRAERNEERRERERETDRSSVKQKVATHGNFRSVHRSQRQASVSGDNPQQIRKVYTAPLQFQRLRAGSPCARVRLVRVELLATLSLRRVRVKQPSSRLRRGR